DVTVGWTKAADVEAKPAGHRGPDLVSVEPLAFDLAALEDVFGKGAENGFLSQTEANRLHPANETPLLMPRGGQRRRQAPLVPVKPGPVRKLMYICSHSPLFLR